MNDVNHEKDHKQSVSSNDHVEQLVVTVEELDTWCRQLHPNNNAECCSKHPTEDSEDEIQSPDILRVSAEKSPCHKLR
jgi:hypothetical protein